jgi:SAM-dependent methyltransferase
MGTCLSLLELAHASIQRAVTAGSLVVDATAGNGNDTLFLAGLVGPTGLVLAFDIQPDALENTRAALEKANLAARVRLFLTGHENIAACLPGNAVPPPVGKLAASLTAKSLADPALYLSAKARVSAAMFNLGFLPGSEKEIATRPSTTLAALIGLQSAMLPGAVISIHCYSGHDGGREESKAVLDWAARQPEDVWRVYRYETLNKKRGAENLILMERRPATVCSARLQRAAGNRQRN